MNKTVALQYYVSNLNHNNLTNIKEGVHTQLETFIQIRKTTCNMYVVTYKQARAQPPKWWW